MVGLGRNVGVSDVGNAPSDETQKVRLLGTHCQAPMCYPGVDVAEPTLKMKLSHLDSGSRANQENDICV